MTESTSPPCATCGHPQERHQPWTEMRPKICVDCYGDDPRDGYAHPYTPPLAADKPSHFHATPAEIDAFLRAHFAEDTLLRYQQAIGRQAVSEAVADQRTKGQELPVGQTLAGLLFAAEWVDPTKGGGHYPSELINLTPKEN